MGLLKKHACTSVHLASGSPPLLDALDETNDQVRVSSVARLSMFANASIFVFLNSSLPATSCRRITSKSAIRAVRSIHFFARSVPLAVPLTSSANNSPLPFSHGALALHKRIFSALKLQMRNLCLLFTVTLEVSDATSS